MNNFVKDGKLGYSKHEAEKLMAEVNDPEKVQLFCGKHQYVPDLLKAPLHQCEECWQAYIFLFIASMPPHLRDEVVESLQEFAHKTVENPFGFTPFLHPEVTIEKQ